MLLFMLCATLLSSLLLLQCANPVMPVGGPRDMEPPRVLVSDPLNYTTDFTERNITITFDEFVNITKLQQELLISPPLNSRPEFRIRGRRLQLRFMEDLKPETTYTIFFGNGIVDLTEGNPLRDFTFVFSTGAIIDSMSMSGNMRHAFDLEAAENAFLMLYLIDNDTLPLDSLPYLVKPYYVTRTDQEGNFLFNNLRNERFKIFGLADRNSNFIYDMSGEAIAFLDTLVTPAYFKPLADSLFLTDSLLIKETEFGVDTVEMTTMVIDSLKRAAELERQEGKSFYELMMFTEVDSTQRLLRAELVKEGLLQFVFRYPAAHVEVVSMDTISDDFGLLRQFSKAKDTLFWYFKPQVYDSLRINVRFDTLINDTLHLSLSPRLTGQEARRAARSDAPVYLQVFNNVRARRLDIDKDLIFRFDYPVIEYKPHDSIRFVANGDTTYNSIEFEKVDQIGLQYRLKYEFEPEGVYNLFIPDSCFRGLNDTWNDTIRVNVRIPPLSEYGNLFINLILPEDEQHIIQLLNNRGDVIREMIVKQSQQIVFYNLLAGRYNLKAIHDRNRNGRWDTGDYLKGIQPERVFLFSKEMEIRGNWDFEEDWDILNGL